MTKQQLQSNYDVKGLVDHPAFFAVIGFLAGESGSRTERRDAHTIINDEGFLRGRAAVLKELREIGIVQRVPEKDPDKHAYSEPAILPPKVQPK